MDGPGNVQPMIEPDADQMLRHLEHLFAGDLDGCHEGKLELAWTDGDDRKLRHAAIFGTDQLEEMVERAIAVNKVPGQNVYIGQALRDPGIPPFGRCKDEDFFALTAFYVDLDDDVIATARINYRHRGCPPTAVVVTGRHPHVRAQMLWRLETPERDTDACRSQNLALANALEGDPSVINPSRVLRLGGSIAWPTKPGRVLERTEFLIFDDGRPKVYFPGQIAKAFPAEQTGPASVAPSPTSSNLNIGSEFDGVSVEACLAEARAGRHWHNNLIRLTAHWIARGWSDEEILTAAEALTLPGYEIEQTRQEIARMTASGRAKWNIANPDHGVIDDGAGGLRLADWTADRYAGEAEPIQWLCKGTIPLGVPGLIAAMGGIGKSYLALDLALQIAAGVTGLARPKLILGGRIETEGSAVVLTAEDSFDAIHRRFNGIDPNNIRLRHPNRLMVVPLSDAGGTKPLVASDGRNLTATSFYASLRDELLGIDDLRLVVIDPLQAFVMADVNADPAAAQHLWSMLVELAASTGATVLVTHHMRKDGGFGIRNPDDAREAIRGSTALVDGARFAYALWKLGQDETQTVGEALGVEVGAGDIARGAVVKANDAMDFSMHSYLRAESGLLQQCEDEPDIQSESEASLDRTQTREFLIEVQRRFDAGTPFSHAPNSGARYLVNYLMRQKELKREPAFNLVTDWMNSGFLGVDTVDRKTKLSGLRVLVWP